MWKAVLAFACAILGIVFVRASAKAPWIEWEVSVVSVENLTPGYEVVLSSPRWNTRLSDKWDVNLARRNGLGVVQSGNPCGDDMMAAINRSQQDVAFEERLKLIVEGVTSFASIVTALSTVNYFWVLFRVFQRSRAAVFKAVSMTLLYCVTVTVVLALVDPTITMHWPCILVDRGTTVHGEVALQANLIGLRPEAIANLIAGVVALLVSLGMILWQLLPWWRSAITMKATKNTG